MTQAKEIVDLIKSSENIVITSHKSPDGDSIGCSLGLLRFIQALGKKAEICHPDSCPDYLNWVIQNDVILDYENSQEQVKNLMLQADLIFCLDYNGSGRMGEEMGRILDQATGTKVMIDHHPNPADFVNIAVSIPETCSTCQLIYDLIDYSGNKNLLNAGIGTPIYMGIVTDTGSFRFSSVQPRTHEIVAELIRCGVNHTKVHELTFDNIRPEQLKLRGYALSEKLVVVPEYHIAYISLTDKELSEYHYVKGDTEGLVNIALAVQGVLAAALFQEKDGLVKISFRSKGTIPVNKLAANHFEGGGHVNAAGGISKLSMVETLDKFRSLLPVYFKNEYV